MSKIEYERLVEHLKAVNKALFDLGCYVEDYIIHTPKCTVEDELRDLIEKARECRHEWEADNVVYASSPPQYKWTCKKCGKSVYRPCDGGAPGTEGCSTEQLVEEFAERLRLKEGE